MSELLTSFVLGLLTPLTALCILPLYPGFVAYLANRVHPNAPRQTMAILGALIVFGVLLFMVSLGLVFTTLLQQSLTQVVSIVSPIAFFLLAGIGLFLIFGADFSRFISFSIPQVKNPYLESLVYGFFFGAIIIPCNPGFIAAFFSTQLATGAASFAGNILHVIVFGLGIGTPLLVLATVSSAVYTPIISFLIRHKRAVNVFSGILLIGISVYYLFFVFRIFG